MLFWRTKGLTVQATKAFNITDDMDLVAHANSPRTQVKAIFEGDTSPRVA
jgi:hypothetical protein